MPKGVPTPPGKVAEFRARYLLTGNASKTARDMDMPETTGQKLAKDAHKDPEFVAACADQRARAIDAATLMLLRTVERAEERVATTYLYRPEPGCADVTWQAARTVVDAHKSLVAMAKLDAEKSGEITPANVVVNLVPVDGDGVPVDVIADG